jgi:short-subunit dehydrogenase
MPARLDLRGARALLTGATGGLGHAIAKALHERGCDLVLTGRRTDVLEPLAAALGAESIAADLSDADDVDRLLAAAGRVDVLVANAALPASGALLDYTPEQVRRALAVNLEAPILMARAAGAAMVERGRGHVVLVGSVAGIAASAKTPLYNATKFGLRGFALGFRGDLRGTGVGVSIVEPGFVREAGMFVEGGGQLPRGVRTVSPEDVAVGVLRAIDRDKAEVVVAPTEMKVAAAVGGLLPGFSAAVQRRLGGDEVTDSLVRGQASKR